MFMFAYTDTSKDLDVSNLFDFHRVVEYSISTVRDWAEGLWFS